MENFRQELEAKNRVIASIFRISNLLTRQVSLDEILEAILQSAKKDLGFSAACLFLINRDGETLQCRMVTGFSHESELKSYQEPFHLHRHDCIETLVVKTGETVYFEDAFNDHKATRIDKKLTVELGRGRIVYAPLTVKGKIIGCMGVNRPIGLLPISPSEIEAFTIFANQASIIIENSKSSEQLVAERNLKENVLESSPNGILCVDKSGKIIEINKAAAAILSIDSARALDSRIEDLTGLKSGFEFLAGMSCGSPLPAAGALTRALDFSNAESKKVYLEVTASALKDHAGNETGTIFLIQDVTERRIISEQVQRMSKLATIGQLAAGISHEIRNPLMGIEAALELASEALGPDDPQRKLLLKSMEEIDRVDNIIGELLNLSRIREMDLKPADLNQVIGKAADFLAGLCQKANVEIEMDLQEQLPAIAMDQEKIREAVINICLNAVQSMTGKGTLKISTSALTGDIYEMRRGGARITVEDNGKGIPPELMDKVFDPFFTTRPAGTGLGLYNCNKIVEAHRGLIFIENIKPGGTRVSIVLPYEGEP